MKKDDVKSLLVYVGMIVIAIVVGLVVIKPLFENGVVPAGLNPYLFMLLALLLALVVNGVGLELGHMLGGKIGGYKTVSICIFGFRWYLDQKKWKFRFGGYDGLTGETQVVPAKEKLNHHWYIWIPIILFVIEVAAGAVIFAVFNPSTRFGYESGLGWLSVFGITFLSVGALLAIYNLLPVRLDSLTDGYRFVLFSDKRNKEVFNEVGRVQKCHIDGKPVTDIKLYDFVSDFTTYLYSEQIEQLIIEEKYKEAEELLDKVMSDTEKMYEEQYYALLSQKMFIILLTKSEEEAKDFYVHHFDNTARKYVSMINNFIAIRTYVLIEGLIEDSEGEVRYSINTRKPKVIKKVLSGDIEVNEKLFNIAVDKAYAKHTDWLRD